MGYVAISNFSPYRAPRDGMGYVAIPPLFGDPRRPGLCTHGKHAGASRQCFVLIRSAGAWESCTHSDTTVPGIHRGRERQEKDQPPPCRNDERARRLWAPWVQSRRVKLGSVFERFTAETQSKCQPPAVGTSACLGVPDLVIPRMSCRTPEGPSGGLGY